MRKLFLLFSVVLISSCVKYEVQYEGPTPLNEEPIIKKFRIPVVFAEGYSITLTNNYFDRFKQLVNGNDWIDGMALNDAKDRVAYKTDGGNVKIIDTSGVLIQEIENFHYSLYSK